MNCKRCGEEIPSYVIRGECFECPSCGHRYYRKAPASSDQRQPVRQQPRQTQRTARPQYQQPAPQTRAAKQQASGIMPFRTARMVIGILSAILFIIVMFQSCAANVVNTLEQNAADTSAGGGVLVAFALLIAGVTSAIGRDSVKATMVAGIIYVVSALIGFISHGTYGDLVIWSVVALIFGALNMFCWWKGKSAR